MGKAWENGGWGVVRVQGDLCFCKEGRGPSCAESPRVSWTSELGCQAWCDAAREILEVKYHDLEFEERVGSGRSIVSKTQRPAPLPTTTTTTRTSAAAALSLVLLLMLLLVVDVFFFLLFCPFFLFSSVFCVFLFGVFFSSSFVFFLYFHFFLALPSVAVDFLA